MAVTTPPGPWPDVTGPTVDIQNPGYFTQVSMDALCTALSILGGSNGWLGTNSKLNQLINGGFEVWQRGNGTFSSNLVYTADRWQLSLGGSSTCNIVRDTTNFDVGSQYSLSTVYTHNGASEIQQRLENFVQFRGVPCTFACRVKCNTAAASRVAIFDGATTTYSPYHSGSNLYEWLYVTATPAGAAANVDVQLRMDATANTFWDNATFCTGNAPLPYSPLPPDMELLRCQRYYEIIGVSSSGAVMVAGIATAGLQSAYQTIPFKATKAGVPTITLSGTFALTNCSGQPTKLSADVHSLVLQVNNTAAGLFSAVSTGSGSAIVAEFNV